MKIYSTIVSDADIEMMMRIEAYVATYDRDDLLHDIDLKFPGASYRAFFLGYRRALERIASNVPILRRWPAAFNLARRPLKTGITYDIQGRVGDISLQSYIAEDVREWVKHPLYLRNLIAGGSRIDLDGKAAGFVTIDQQQFAWKELKTLRDQIQAGRTNLTIDDVREEMSKVLPAPVF